MEKEHYIKIKKKYMKDILKMENMMDLVQNFYLMEKEKD